MSASRPEPLRHINRLLATPELQRIARLAAAQQRLALLWKQIVPVELSQAAQAVGVVDGCLLVTTRSPAIAAKLRQMETRLLARLIENGLEVNAIRVKVQVETLPHQQTKPKRNPVLSDAARDTLADAARSLPPSPLADALARMANRRR
ncbi:DciA family protein [Chitinimonas lacunae]|uniref:DciA family protein n=1 Tax=Chitinimonas lacunae TaxID=1963018 RepID=A0ABV8MRP6_9NEIS